MDRASLHWLSEDAAESCMLIIPTRAYDETIRDVTDQLTRMGWTQREPGTKLLAGHDASGRLWLGFGAVAALCAAAAREATSGWDWIVIAASCHYEQRVRVLLKRWLARTGVLVESPYPEHTMDGLRGNMSDRFNEAANAIDDRVRRLMSAGLASELTADEVAPTLEVVTQLAPPAIEGSPRVRMLVMRARAGKRYELTSLSGKPALAIEGFDGIKQISVLNEAEETAVRAHL